MTADASARVIAVRDDIIRIQGNGIKPLMKNEVIYICPRPHHLAERQEYLQAEVLRVKGNTADAQVFESTQGVSVGDAVIQTGAMLSVTLGPGLLGQVYDGLQNPLPVIALQEGYFLPRGLQVSALNRQKSWSFTPRVRIGARLSGGDSIGTVQEGRFTHRIMLPFDIAEEVEITWIQAGNFCIDTVIARYRDASGDEQDVSMHQRWPVRIPLAKGLQQRHKAQRQYPDQPLLTSLRLIDTFFPIAKGGTACIPGPFGAGKTVLQGLIARFSDVDIVIIVACGERAGEVVETISEFPNMSDPRGGTLMDRTIIICNTSSMPVAAREASIYTGVTLAEYYRQMGLAVLLIADSTSRWAQAMRETSGRLEEIPGEEAFPAYLDSSIRALYERAGVITNAAGDTGSLTLIGTVSPAGGNFEEPVTQSTLRTVKTFLGLSAERAYRRAYPAVDPLLSWSRYRLQLAPWFEQHLGKDWASLVDYCQTLLRQGQSVERMMQVTGEEGVTLEDYIVFHQAQCLDTVYLQQDAFDSVDVATPLTRQQSVFRLLLQALAQHPVCTSKDDVRRYFTQLSGWFRNLNYSATNSPEYKQYEEKIRQSLVSVSPS